MKKITVFISCFILFLSSCKKNEVPGDSAAQSLIENAKSFFNGTYSKSRQGTVQTNNTGSHQNPRVSGSRIVLWEQASIFKTGNSRVVIAPVQYGSNFAVQSNFGLKAIYAINQIVKLCIYSDSTGQLHSIMLTFFPDSNYKANSSFTGVTFVDDWLGNPITKYKFEKGGAILKWNGNNPQLQESATQTESIQTETVGITETCITITGYNYVADDPSDTYAWSESGGCVYSADQESLVAGIGRAGISSGAIGAIGATNPYISSLEVIIPGGDNVIGSIASYFQCFSDVGGTDHVFTVTVCVNQPIPGTRDCWGTSGVGSSANGNPVNVGHVFLVMTEISPSGTITRNVGFYPQGKVGPSSPVSQGQLNNDADHTYNISLSITTTNAQFYEILNYIAQGNNSGYEYNLNSNNCTSFIINALDQASIYLPSTVGMWFNGSGNDPGDLGEDIRGMTLSSNMTRNTVFNDHPNLGICN